MRYRIDEQQAEIIKEALNKKGNTMTELGNYLGVKYKTIWQWFTGKRQVSKAYITLMNMFFEGSLKIYVKGNELVVEKVV